MAGGFCRLGDGGRLMPVGVMLGLGCAAPGAGDISAKPVSRDGAVLRENVPKEESA